jgi:hypothetical protein
VHGIVLIEAVPKFNKFKLLQMVSTTVGIYCRLIKVLTWIHSFVPYQNLNSGSLLINGLNSSSDLVGSVGPSSSSSEKS